MHLQSKFRAAVSHDWLGVPGLSSDWFNDPLETSGVGGGTLLLTTRHDLSGPDLPFGCVYDAVNPLLDSIVSIDHRVTP